MKKLILVLFISSCSGMAMGAGLNPAPGMGEAIGLSGAYTAVCGPETACTFYYNPCAILKLTDPLDHRLKVSFNADVILPRYSIRKDIGFGQSKKSDPGTFYPLPLLGINKRLSEDVAVGLGVYTPYGLGATYERDLTKGFYKGETLLSLTNVSPTLALRLSDSWSMGFSLNIGYGQFQFDAPFDIKGRPLPIPTKNKVDGFGLGGSLSLRWQPSESFTWAITATSPTTIDFEGGKSRIQLGLLTIKDNFNSEFTFPGKIGTGIALKIHSKWTMSADYNYYFYDAAVGDMKLDFKRLPIVKSSALDWHDVFSAHFGFRYQATDKMYLDMGVGYQPAAIPDSTVSQLTPDVPGWSVSTGIGYQTKKFDLTGYVGYAWGERDVSRSLKHREPGHYYAGVWRIGAGVHF